MSNIVVRPATDAAGTPRWVRLPDGILVPAEGMELPLDLFLRRRLADGDLVEVTPAAEPPGEATPAAPPPAKKGGRTDG